MMLCVSIQGPTYADAHEQIARSLEYADLVELRLDRFDDVDIQAIQTLRSHFTIPMIFTLRSCMQGGNYREVEEMRLKDLRRLAALEPEYLDLESYVEVDFINEIAYRHPHIKLIISHHDFEAIPNDLDALYHDMKKNPAHFYKIAVTSKNCVETLKLLSWAKQNQGQLIAIGMGSHGQISRILGPVFGNPITYAALEENQPSAPGQLSAQILVERYHFHTLNSKTALYGLIGDPVDWSISDETHNALMHAVQLDAVYVKMAVTALELSDFLDNAQLLGFCGLSVTMPLKEVVLQYLDEIDLHAQEIGAVNTLVFQGEKITGYNTDGVGALNALERVCAVQGKRLFIIGTGGSAKAIVHESQLRGGFVTIMSRDLEKGMRFAERFKCLSISLEVQIDYDILINCTPACLPIDPIRILPESIVMDLTTRPKDTELLQQALKKNCRVVYGQEMFVEQALGQFQLWFKGVLNLQESKCVLENQSIKVLTFGKSLV